MMIGASRRNFLATAAAAAVASVAPAAAQGPGSPPADEPDYGDWSQVRALYDINPSHILLGTVVRGIAAGPVRDAAARWEAQAQTWRARPGSEEPPASARAAREEVRAHVAQFVNASPEEVALTRNTTEGVTTVFAGLPMRADDEILTTRFEHLPFYGALLHRVRRDGLALRTVPLPAPAANAEDLVAAFTDAMTPRTRLVFVSHVMLTGQIMPVARIAEETSRRGVRLLVDGALALGHVPVDVRALGCDYYSGNFHKWSGGMPGTGLLYVRRGLSAELPPLFGHAEVAADGSVASRMDADDVTKFERGGRYSEANLLALREVIELQRRIGPERLRARLHALSRRWTARAERLPGFRAAAGFDPVMSASLVAWELEGRDPLAIARELYRARRVVLGVTDPFAGLFGAERPRALILTNTAMFTSEEEADRFAAILEQVASGDVGRS